MYLSVEHFMYDSLNYETCSGHKKQPVVLTGSFNILHTIRYKIYIHCTGSVTLHVSTKLITKCYQFNPFNLYKNCPFSIKRQRSLLL